jgi:uncharacterized protein
VKALRPLRSAASRGIARRELLTAALASTAGLTLGSSGCRAKVVVTREQVLAALVRDVFVPDTRQVVSTSRRLEQALVSLAKQPGPRTLRPAQQAWKTAALAWKRVECFREGPIKETSALARAQFWPVRIAAIDAALTSSEPIDARFVDALGADVKGMFALEALLFPAGAPGDASERFRGDAGARRRELSVAYAESIARYASLAAAALGDGAAFAERFAADGALSLGALLTEIIMSIERLAVERLDGVIVLDKRGKLELDAIEGGRSGTSHELVVAQFAATERLYRGGRGGVAALVAAAAPVVARRIDQRFETASTAVRALTTRLDELVRRDRPRLVAAIAAMKMLEIAIKLEVASALGLTLTFAGADGD